MAINFTSVDAVLASQSASTATIETIDGKPELIRVIPWTGTTGCLCHAALEIKKALLAGVTPTGTIHSCCGKMRRVVELHFKQAVTMAPDEVLKQLQGSAAKSALAQVSAQPLFVPGYPPPGSVPHPPWDCNELALCLNSPGCNGNIFCDECGFYRLACTPFGAFWPLFPLRYFDSH